MNFAGRGSTYLRMPDEKVSEDTIILAFTHSGKTFVLEEIIVVIFISFPELCFV
jgi:hypothetical protein